MSINHLTAKFCHCLFYGHQFCRRQFSNHLVDQRGQGLIEYVLLVSLIAITLIGSLISLKEIIQNVIANIPF